MKSLSSLSIVVKSEKHRAWTIGVHHGEVPAWSLTDFTAYNGLTLDNLLQRCPLAQLAHPLFCLPKRETAHPPYTGIHLSHLSIVIRLFYPTYLCSLELRWDNPHGHVLEFLRLWSVALLDFNQNCSSFEKSLAKHQEPKGIQLQFYFWLSMISTNFTQPQNRWYVYRCVFVAQRAHHSSHLLLHLSIFKFQRPCAIGVERVKDFFDRDHLFHFHVHILCLAVNPEHTGDWYTNRSFDR